MGEAPNFTRLGDERPQGASAAYSYHEAAAHEAAFQLAAFHEAAFQLAAFQEAEAQLAAFQEAEAQLAWFQDAWFQLAWFHEAVGVLAAAALAQLAESNEVPPVPSVATYWLRARFGFGT